MRTSDTVKAAVSVGAVVVAVVFLARYFGGDGMPAVEPGVAEPALTPDEERAVERVKQEQLDRMTREEITPVGA